MDQETATQETTRIRSVYAQRDAGGKRALYSWNAPGAALVEYRKRHVWARALDAAALPNLNDLQVLDVGCGDGAWLRMLLEWGARADRLHGIDLLDDRILAARAKSTPGIDFECGSGWPLPYADNALDLTAASTVFSSILDPQARLQLGRQISRVTKPGGCIMLYDFIVSHPQNPHTTGIGRREIKRIFPGLEIEQSHCLTLLPPLSRKLTPLAPWFAHTLECALPFLCTHRLFVLRQKAALAAAA